MNERNRWLIAIGIALSAFGTGIAQADPLPELFCTIRSQSDDLSCQYKENNDSKTFSDDDVVSFIDQSMSGAYITIKSKKGFERVFEVDPTSAPFKQLRDKKKTMGVTELASAKLDLFQQIERKAVQASNNLDASYIESDIIKTDPAVAADKCKMDMNGHSSGIAYEKNLEQLTAENRALSIYLTSLLKAFKEPGSCLSDYRIDVGSDGTVALSQLQGLSQAFKNHCKRRL